MKALIDTNIILDVFMHREFFYVEAEKIVLLAAGQDITGCITASQITDIHYFLKRYYKKGALEILKKIMRLFEVLPVSREECWQALSVGLSDYEDAILVICAEKNAVDCIVTRNLKDFKNSPVKALGPSEFLAAWNS